MTLIQDLAPERRKKARFPIQRELRYKILNNGAVVASGLGRTLDMGSGGVAFHLDQPPSPGSLIELSISWPVLLGNACPMRLVVYGLVLRADSHKSVCLVDKYEFRTQAVSPWPQAHTRCDSTLLRWADSVRKETAKLASA